MSLYSDNILRNQIYHIINGSRDTVSYSFVTEVCCHIIGALYVIFANKLPLHKKEGGRRRCRWAMESSVDAMHHRCQYTRRRFRKCAEIKLFIICIRKCRWFTNIRSQYLPPNGSVTFGAVSDRMVRYLSRLFYSSSAQGDWDTSSSLTLPGRTETRWPG